MSNAIEQFTHYIQELHRYLHIAEALHVCLDRYVTLVKYTADRDNFIPTHKRVRDQLAHWPPDQSFPLPPSLWVQPRKGEASCLGETWEFAFHGQGVSFIRNSDSLDVSVEYTAHGELGIEEYNVTSYLSIAAPDLLPMHHHFFAQCVETQILVPQPARFGSDSDTYVFNQRK